METLGSILPEFGRKAEVKKPVRRPWRRHRSSRVDGGYRNLWIAKEGWKVARELQRLGIAGVVLEYRYYDRFAVVQDAQRAVRVVRSHAREWHINDRAVGIGGFSAGGHLALHMAAQLGRPEGWPPDDVDRLSKRPDFL